jgi:hypothetical protein
MLRLVLGGIIQELINSRGRDFSLQYVGIGSGALPASYVVGIGVFCAV